MLGFVVVWNLVCFIGVLLNGGFGKIHSVPSALVMAVACGGLAFIGFGSLAIPSVRSVVLLPTAELSTARPGLIFIGILGSALTLGAIYTAFSHAY